MPSGRIVNEIKNDPVFTDSRPQGSSGQMSSSGRGNNWQGPGRGGTQNMSDRGRDGGSKNLSSRGQGSGMMGKGTLSLCLPM